MDANSVTQFGIVFDAIEQARQHCFGLLVHGMDIPKPLDQPFSRRVHRDLLTIPMGLLLGNELVSTQPVPMREKGDVGLGRPIQ